MKVKALWYGGINYANPDPDKDLESFDSLKQAVSVFESREDDPDNSEMHVYFGDYTENGPDRIIRFGQRGGVRIEPA